MTRPACKQFLAILQVWGRALSSCRRKLFSLVWEIGAGHDFGNEWLLHIALICKCARITTKSVWRSMQSKRTIYPFFDTTDVFCQTEKRIYFLFSACERRGGGGGGGGTADIGGHFFQLWLVANWPRLVCLIWFLNLRPINNISGKKGRVFLGWTSAKLG